MSPPNTKRQRSLRRAFRGGVTTVEFAFAAGILFTLTLASVEISRMNMIRNMSENTAYEASRMLIVPGAKVDDATKIAVSMLKVAGIEKARIDVSPAVITPQTSVISVGVSIPLDENCWLPPLFLGDRVVTSTCTLHRGWVSTVPTALPKKGSSSVASAFINDETVTTGTTDSSGTGTGGSSTTTDLPAVF